MTPKLAHVLIEKNILKRNSVLQAYYNTKGISCQLDTSTLGSFKLNGAQAVGEWVFFNAIGPDNKQYRIRCDDIISIDGMTMRRVAESHQLTIEGEVLLSKRNRRIRAMNETEDDDEEEASEIIMDTDH